ncbi:MAG: divergent polysaccharide deacetylase family protein [Alphaproteobacteria bacterium]|nr:divergent polysaccharide deacetylase family protein [Alphaproteobacteria bacterium]
MRKISIFVCLLLAVVIGEIGFLLYDGFNSEQPTANRVKEMILPGAANAQVVATESEGVNPLLFERHSSEEVGKQLDEISDSLKFGKWLEEISKTEESAVAQEEIAVQEQTEEQPENGVAEVVVTEQEEVQEVAINEETAEPAEAPIVVQEEIVAEEVVAVEPAPAEKVIERQEKAVENTENKVLVAVVIDDIGLSVPFSREISGFNKPLTLSMLPYGASNKKQAEMLRKAGFEVMLHVPMMPHVPANLAPVTLSPEMSKKEIQDDLETMLARFEGSGIVGANNHMGSLFTEKETGMRYFMEFLKSKGLYFMDSRTTAKSVGKKVAAEYGVPFIERDVFLDNERDYKYIMGQFKKLENIAKKKGHAVAIGHPYGQTLKALRDWAAEAENRGVKLVTTYDLVRKINNK